MVFINEVEIEKFNYFLVPLLIGVLCPCTLTVAVGKNDDLFAS